MHVWSSRASGCRVKPRRPQSRQLGRTSRDDWWGDARNSEPETDVRSRDFHKHFLGASRSHCVPRRSLASRSTIVVPRAKFLLEPARTHRHSRACGAQDPHVIGHPFLQSRTGHPSCNGAVTASCLAISSCAGARTSDDTGTDDALSAGTFDVLVSNAATRCVTLVLLSRCSPALGFLIVDSLLAMPCNVSFGFTAETFSVRLVVSCVFVFFEFSFRILSLRQLPWCLCLPTR